MASWEDHLRFKLTVLREIQSLSTQVGHRYPWQHDRITQRKSRKMTSCSLTLEVRGQSPQRASLLQTLVLPWLWEQLMDLWIFSLWVVKSPIFSSLPGLDGSRVLLSSTTGVSLGLHWSTCPPALRRMCCYLWCPKTWEAPLGGAPPSFS